MNIIVARIPRVRFVVILGFLLLILVLAPVLQEETRPGMSRMLGLLGLVVPILALAAIDAPGRPRRIALALAALCLMSSVDSIAGFSHLPPQIGIALCVIFLAYTTVRLFMGVVASPTVTADVIAGALSSYMLVALTFAFAYGLLETVRPGSIHGLGEGGAPLDFPSLLYFSYITLLTIGYGDITPLSAAARMMTVVEGLLGMTFTTVVLAVLVAAHLRHRDNRV